MFQKNAFYVSTSSKHELQITFGISLTASLHAQKNIHSHSLFTQRYFHSLSLSLSLPTIHL